MRRFLFCGLVLVLSLGLCRAAEAGAAAVQCTVGTGSYAVVVSEATLADAAWKAVVDALRAKHEASVIVTPKSVWDALPALRRVFPRYACFVARPEEAGRDFVVAVHRLTRRLDDDPYTDLVWGILTGYEAADALRIAQLREPLVITRGAAGTGLNLGVFDAGYVYSEGEAGAMWEKLPGGDTVKKQVPPDTTKALVDTFNVFQTQLFLTSGHATEHDWQIGYSYKNGQFRCKDGQLFGLDLQRKPHPINSPNPKVFLPVGNCLIGHVSGRDCMATAMMHAGGVAQMFGYTVPTWHGYGGWGIKDIFVDLPGRYSLAEAFFVNTQALLHQIATRFPQSLGVDFEAFDLERDRELLGKLAFKHGLVDPATRQLRSRDELGLLWDRDTVAFYGDPAWDARLKPRPLPWETKLTVREGDAPAAREGDAPAEPSKKAAPTPREGDAPAEPSPRGTYTFELLAREKCGTSRPPLHFLPHRVADVAVVEGAEFAPVITDNFLLLPKPGQFEKGQTCRVVFRARRIVSDPSKPTAAEAARSEALALLPAESRDRVAQALDQAWPNEAALVAALRSALPDHREALAFLLMNMPPNDLRSLSKDFLLENVALAFRARDEAPWAKNLPHELFLNYVLPYANVNERRDAWRRDFRDRFLPLVRDCQMPGEAARRLNEKVFPALGVRYHGTERPKPDQSPYESIQAKFASCTGLSILLIDACRAVGVPARLVGIPLWPDRSNNHTWVEVWDGRQWRFVGAAEPAALDQAWFVEKARQADASKPEHRIVAASFARTPLVFPLPWNPLLDTVRAVDVTPFYTARRHVTFRILDREGGKPVKATLTLRLNGQLVAHAPADDTAAFDLAGGLTYDAEFRPLDGSPPATRRLPVPDAKDPSVTMALQ